MSAGCGEGDTLLTIAAAEGTAYGDLTLVEALDPPYRGDECFADFALREEGSERLV